MLASLYFILIASGMQPATDVLFSCVSSAIAEAELTLFNRSINAVCHQTFNFTVYILLLHTMLEHWTNLGDRGYSSSLPEYEY